MWVAHFGVVIFMLGAVGDNLFNREQVVRAKPGDVIQIADRNVTFTGVKQVEGPNYQALAAQLEYRDEDGRFFALLTPEKRVYNAERQTTTEAAIRPTLRGDDYAVLGDGDSKIGYTLRLYYKPLVSWIWGGAVIMALGGLIAAFGRQRAATKQASPQRNAASGNRNDRRSWLIRHHLRAWIGRLLHFVAGLPVWSRRVDVRMRQSTHQVP